MPPAVSARLPEGLRVLQLRSIYDHDLQVALCAHLTARGVQGGGAAHARVPGRACGRCFCAFKVLTDRQTCRGGGAGPIVT